MTEFSELKGQVLEEIKILTGIDHQWNHYPYDKIVFLTKDGKKYAMNHERDCCEEVYIKEISGSLKDLIGEPITEADCVTNEGGKHGDETYTWTFYKIGTSKGSVTISWYGSSNGYYSETVYFGLKDRE